MKARARVHRWASLSIVALLLASGLPSPAAHAEGDGASGPDVRSVLARLKAALGGEDAWRAARFFSFELETRRHFWDKKTGRHRMETVGADGSSIVALQDLDRRKGKVYRNGKLVEGEGVQTLVDRAYQRWCSDSFWLFLPYKLEEPGTSLTYDGSEVIAGVTYDKLLFSYPTIGDRYWVYVNRETGLMEQQATQMGYDRDKPPSVWLWKDWKQYGGILLAAARQDAKTGGAFRISGIAVYDTLGDAVFESPEPVKAEP